MDPPPTLPDHPELAALACELDERGLAADILDENWSLVWVSQELKALLGEHDERELGYGLHTLEAMLGEAWLGAVTPASLAELAQRTVPYWAASAPRHVLEQLGQRVADVLGELPASLHTPLSEIPARMPPPAWTHEFGFRYGDHEPLRVGCLATRLHDADGAFIGVLEYYTSALSPRLLTTLVRGDELMYERMANLAEPGRRAAAIVFADLQASGELSRRLSSAAYFRLVRAMITELDSAVIRSGGIVGKHAGDGATAFFLADQLGSRSAAARAALATAKAIPAIARRIVRDEPNVAAQDCLINVGVHWGAALYIGQVVTGGRLEVTALGDEVNEAARIQQSARGGALLASKDVVEQLKPDDAVAIELAQDDTRYRTVRDLPDAAGKAVRDAGNIAVTEL